MYFSLVRTKLILMQFCGSYLNSCLFSPYEIVSCAFGGSHLDSACIIDLVNSPKPWKRQTSRDRGKFIV